MPMIVANSGSTYTASQAIPNSANRWAWFNLVPNIGASGASAVLHLGSTSAAASPFLPLIVASGPMQGMFGPFNSPNGFFAACITTGSLVFWATARAS